MRRAVGVELAEGDRGGTGDRPQGSAGRPGGERERVPARHEAFPRGWRRTEKSCRKGPHSGATRPPMISAPLPAADRRSSRGE